MKQYLLLLITLASAHVHADWELIPNTGHFNTPAFESDGERLYLGNRDGVYISDDDGDTWRQTDMPHGVEFLEIGDDAIYAFTGSDFGVFRSDDRGETWSPKNNGLINRFSRRFPYLRQILVTTSRMVVAVAYHAGTYVSDDRGDTWHDVSSEWTAPQAPGFADLPLGIHITSMFEFDGYLWAVFSGHHLCLSDDQGETWERLHNNMKDFTNIRDWAILDSRLYVAGGYSLGRWNEDTLAWDALDRGLPSDTDINSLAVNRNRIFAVSPVFGSGVWLFDEMSDTWMPVGMQGVPVFIETILSHKSDLYVASNRGIYRTSLPVVQPYNKAASTWGALKTE